jgi:uncharacterized protein with PIN domain
MQIPMSKCPKCEQTLTQLLVKDVALNAGLKSWNGVTYCCPDCYAVLGVELDPVALKTDIVKELLDALRHQG